MKRVCFRPDRAAWRSGPILLGTLCFFIICIVQPLLHNGGVLAIERKELDQSVEKQVVALVNRARAKGAKCGTTYHRAASPVVWSDTLGRASLTHSMDMADKGFLHHTGSDRKDPGDRITGFGYAWSAYGENVAEGYHSPEEVVKGWLKSKGHCENIMDPSFREAGSAHARGPQGIYWTLLLVAPGKMESFGP
ncbi:MAG TPA: CAP domain-containing protein [Thermodesulfovibrionales bacterium]|nr:CAP domain-containing protein [Thermodesulfovibrionales bacterium]